MPDDTGLGQQVTFVSGIDKDLGGVHTRGGAEADDFGAFLLEGFQRLLRQHGHAGFLDQSIRHAGGDVRFVGPDGVILRGDIVRKLYTAGGVVGGDTRVPFFEQSEQGRADGLIGITEAQPARVDAAHVGGRFDQHDLSAFAGGGDCRAEASGRGAVDDDVSLRGPGDGQGEEQSEGEEVAHRVI